MISSHLKIQKASGRTSTNKWTYSMNKRQMTVKSVLCFSTFISSGRYIHLGELQKC